jgi:DNA-binding LytR/AlgR family response regulator
MKQTHFKSGLWVREMNKLKFVEFDDIAYIEYRNGLSELCLSGDQKQKIQKPLEKIGQKVPSDLFFRIHRNYIINKNYIDYYESGSGLSVVLDGQEFPVSRRRKKDFDDFMSNGLE